MPGSVVGGGGGVRIELRPPIEFILRQTGAFRHQLEDLVPLWELFKPVMSEIEEEQFASQGHGEWPPLAESTLRYKSGGEMLVESGALKSSLVDPGQAAQTGPMQMTWGTDVEYAHWHQDGGTIAGRPPQRKVLDVRAEDRQKLERVMVTWINLVAAETMGRI
jgi:phage gpG-like protein